MKRFFQGFLLSFTIILPGISCGTVFLFLGIYEHILADLAALRFRPYLILGLGTATGLFLWSFFFQKLIDSYPPVVFSFLLGALMASAPIVLKSNSQSLRDFSWKKPVYLCAGALIGWLAAAEPLGSLTIKSSHSLIILFLAGAISSATMLIPGISGSAVLLILGLYEDVLEILSYMRLIPLTLFLTGCIAGLLGLSKVLLLLCKRYQTFFIFFTAGLILGSGRALLPPEITPGAVISAVCGALTISFFGAKIKTPSTGSTGEMTTNS